MDNKNVAGPYNRALDYAFRLLKFRIRSEFELRSRLKRKKFEEAVVEKVLSFLKEKEFVNDREFARLWTQDKLIRPLGIRRIRQELKLKGIEASLINETLSAVKAKYEEGALTLQLARERLKRYNKLEPQKAKRRIYSFLLRRGFSPEAVYNAVNQL